MYYNKFKVGINSYSDGIQFHVFSFKLRFSTVSDLVGIIDILLEFFNKINEKFQVINKDRQVLLVDYSLSNVDLMRDIINKLADMLMLNHLFEDEYLLFLSIIGDIEYIVERDIFEEILYMWLILLLIFVNLFILNRIGFYQIRVLIIKKYGEFFSLYIDEQD